jgi:hypothetical protein
MPWSSQLLFLPLDCSSSMLGVAQALSCLWWRRDYNEKGS